MLLFHCASLHLYLTYIHVLSNTGYYIKQSNFCLSYISPVSAITNCLHHLTVIIRWVNYMQITCEFCSWLRSNSAAKCRTSRWQLFIPQKNEQDLKNCTQLITSLGAWKQGSSKAEILLVLTDQMVVVLTDQWTFSPWRQGFYTALSPQPQLSLKRRTILTRDWGSGDLVHSPSPTTIR